MGGEGTAKINRTSLQEAEMQVMEFRLPPLAKQKVYSILKDNYFLATEIGSPANTIYEQFYANVANTIYEKFYANVIKVLQITERMRDDGMSRIKLIEEIGARIEPLNNIFRNEMKTIREVTGLAMNPFFEPEMFKPEYIIAPPVSQDRKVLITMRDAAENLLRDVSPVMFESLDIKSMKPVVEDIINGIKLLTNEQEHWAIAVAIAAADKIVKANGGSSPYRNLYRDFVLELSTELLNRRSDDGTINRSRQPNIFQVLEEEERDFKAKISKLEEQQPVIQRLTGMVNKTMTGRMASEKLNFQEELDPIESKEWTSKPFPDPFPDFVFEKEQLDEERIQQQKVFDKKIQDLFNEATTARTDKQTKGQKLNDLFSQYTATQKNKFQFKYMGKPVEARLVSKGESWFIRIKLAEGTLCLNISYTAQGDIVFDMQSPDLLPERIMTTGFTSANEQRTDVTPEPESQEPPRRKIRKAKEEKVDA